MAHQEKSPKELELEVQALRQQLEIAEETLRAITQGEVDAVVVSGADGEKVFTLQSPDYPYRRFVEEIQEGAATINSEGIIFYCNQRLASWFQKPLQKVIGSDLRAYILPQDQSIFEGLLQQAQRGVSKGELSLLTRDGREIPVQLSISSLMMDNVTLNCVIATDLTEQKRNKEILAAQTTQLVEFNTQLQNELLERQRVEQALRESETKLQAILDNAPAVIYLKDLQNRHLMVNRYFLDVFQITPEQCIGKTNIQFFPLDIAQQVETHDQDVLRSKKSCRYEEEILLNDGVHTYYSVKFPLFDASGKPYALCGISTDISDRKQAEEQIKASLKEKEVLLKEIHHRVKNNLQIVSSLLQMQSRRTKNRQASLVLQDSQHRIASIALVHEKLYRSEDLANIDFAQYIPDLITHLFESYNVSFENVILSLQVEQIFLEIETAIPCGLIINELVSNSLKYAFPNHRKGKIQVEFNLHSDNTIQLIVRDNGIGIPEEFDIKTSQSLGLTLVQGLVEQLEGTIELERSRGTEVRIIFPGGKR
ncbi:MAG TPA: histidine kinase dimerization/phosphoacceptor domain -containing protein [Stenomitos sp.]